jgi:hypothetical protein
VCFTLDSLCVSPHDELENGLPSQSFIALLVAVELAVVTVAAPAAGVVISNGEFRIDGSSVMRRATLAEGSRLQTGDAPATVQLANGAQAVLGSSAQSRIFHDRVILEQGATQVKASSGFSVEALSLRVAPFAPNSSSRLAVSASNQLDMAVLTGLWHVTNAKGIVVADLAPGTALTFQLPAENAPATATKMKGCLRKKDGHYLLKDETTNVTAELQAADPKTLEDEVHHHIEITGSLAAGVTPVKDATQLIQVAELKRLSKHCRFPGAWLPGKAVIAGILIGTGVATGVIVAVTGGPAPPLSPTVP